MNLPDNLQMAVRAARRKYGITDDADTHLVISHMHRRAISQLKQAAAAIGKATVQIPAGDDAAYQCFVGTRLLGSCTSNKFVNGVRYSVAQIKPNIILEDELTKEKIETNP